VIGDANCKLNCKTELDARKLGTLLIDSGYRIIAGGMGGIMEAACRGAKESKHYREGGTVGLLPGHTLNAANPFVDIVIPTGLDYGRNYLVAHSDAVVAVGGGAGTLSEMCYAWMHKRLIIALGEEGWAGNLAGEKLDWRIRYKDIPDDRIYAASNPREVIKFLSQLLPVYTASNADIELAPPRPLVESTNSASSRATTGSLARNTKA
jgi:uncharacterized protein (TIGR00725 family)